MIVPDSVLDVKCVEPERHHGVEPAVSIGEDERLYSLCGANDAPETVIDLNCRKGAM